MFDGIHSFYDLFMAPLERLWIGKLRVHIVSKASGRVLEVGAGTAVNLPYYSLGKLTELILTDAKEDPDTLKRWVSVRLGRGSLTKSALLDDLADSFHRGEGNKDPQDSLSYPHLLERVRCMQVPVEDLPFDSERFDTVLATLLFCSVKDPEIALREVYRVLRPGGQFLFIEHVRPLDPCTAVLFDSLTPAWRRIASGCHLNRDTLHLILEAGFASTDIQRPGDGVFVGGVGSK